METPVAPAKKATKRATPARKATPDTVELNTPPKSEPIRTLLVASYGWPTDAALPVRQRATRR